MQRLLAIALLSAASAVASAFDQKDLNEEAVIASHWQHLSGEYDAYLHQTFNGARDQLARALKQVPEGKKPAIVTDIDDTLVNGSIFFSSLVGTNETCSVERSRYWWNHQQQELLPGALEFIQYAHSLGIDIFYISGRFEDVKPATIDTLTTLGFPVADKDHILLQPANNNTHSKESKRQSIRDQDYHILMVLGDQLDDFAEVQGKITADRKKWVSANESSFAQQWFILPNTIYGAWEDAIAPGYKKMSPAEKHQARINALSNNASHLNTSDPVYSSHLLLADVWQQASADFDATAYQAFNQAQRVLEQQQNTMEHPAIVVDIDGTILEFIPIYFPLLHKNSPRDNRYQISFLEEMKKAREIPGAKNFLNSAKSIGYEIFYISARPNSTGRSGHENDIKKATIEKLTKHGFPNADSKHVMHREDFCPPQTIPCPKEYKRQAIATGKVNNTPYQITLYVGDLLSDFPLAEQALQPLEKSSVEATRALFGREYFIIPNTVNTSWMKQTYNKAARNKLSEMDKQQQAELRRKLVRDWEEKNNYRKEK